MTHMATSHSHNSHQNLASLFRLIMILTLSSLNHCVGPSFFIHFIHCGVSTSSFFKVFAVRQKRGHIDFTVTHFPRYATSTINIICELERFQILVTFSVWFLPSGNSTIIQQLKYGVKQSIIVEFVKKLFIEI